jgi:hypothetical protein
LSSSSSLVICVGDKPMRNSGAVILIDTAKDLLRDDAKLYGRVFISRIIQAAFERAIIPQEKCEPAFLFVDEAHEYFDTNTKEMLTDLRKFKLGCVFAHHGLEECGASLRAAPATEPAIRMASRVSVDDAKTLASWMRTDADTILMSYVDFNELKPTFPGFSAL